MQEEICKTAHMLWALRGEGYQDPDYNWALAKLILLCCEEAEIHSTTVMVANWKDNIGLLPPAVECFLRICDTAYLYGMRSDHGHSDFHHWCAKQEVAEKFPELFRVYRSLDTA